MTEKTPEQIAAETAEKNAAKAAKAQARTDAKAAKATVKAEAKAAKAKAKADAKADKAAAKVAAKAASKLPSQNDVTRPKAETTTGKAWAVFDALSAETGKPALIGDALKRAPEIAEATVRTQYARWRKFHGITGRAETTKAA